MVDPIAKRLVELGNEFCGQDPIAYPASKYERQPGKVLPFQRKVYDHWKPMEQRKSAVTDHHSGCCTFYMSDVPFGSIGPLRGDMKMP